MQPATWRAVCLPRVIRPRVLCVPPRVAVQVWPYSYNTCDATQTDGVSTEPAYPQRLTACQRHANDQGPPPGHSCILLQQWVIWLVAQAQAQALRFGGRRGSGAPTPAS